MNTKPPPVIELTLTDADLPVDWHACPRAERDAAFRALAEAHHETLFRLALMVESRPGGDPARILRIAAMAALLADALGFDEAAAERLARAAPLADVGLAVLPESVNHLDAGSRAWREHPRLGARLLGGTGVPVLQLAAEIALAHHERWDGRGYPSGILGEGIPLPACIFAVVDYFDAITLGPLDQRLPDARAIEAVTAERGRRFCPQIVDAFGQCADRLARARDFVNAQGIGPAGFDWPEGWWKVM